MTPRLKTCWEKCGESQTSESSSPISLFILVIYLYRDFFVMIFKICDRERVVVVAVVVIVVVVVGVVVIT